MRAPAAGRVRLDEVLVERGLAETRSKARAMILAGDVTVNGIATVRAGAPVGDADVIALRVRPRFVSRGGEKLDHALRTFGVDVARRVCADLGASTGGFTDCLLQAGAARVYAVDVGYGQLDSRLRADPRVVVRERTNARFLEGLPESVSLVTIDVSFISLDLILPVAARLLESGGWCIPLIKPQFEAGKGEVGDRGVVRDSETHRKVLSKVLASAITAGFSPTGLTKSPLRGPAGNVEFLAALRFVGEEPGTEGLQPVESLIDEAMERQ
jgi:23S rRNA (cytidine1920-2'-O)/16S rRNA (cytidine1409-2'-O)-methyltransferase